MRAALALVLTTLTLGGCTQPTNSPARRYLGEARPSTIGPLCPPSKAEAQIREGAIIFTPDEGTWIVQGLASPDGAISADKTVQSATGKPWTTTFEGRWSPTAITGVYTTPRCTFQVSLKAG